MTQISLKTKTKVWMQIILTFVTLGVAVYLLVSSAASDSTKKLAAGWIGMVIGHWFH